MSDIHTFDNGIRVRDEHIIDAQRPRYEKINLHEPEEEAWITKLVGTLGPGPGVFVDVGAAVGYYCFLVHGLNPELELHAFEPLGENRERLADNAELNGVGGIIVHPEALADRAGSAHLAGDRFGAHLDRHTGVAVETKTIDGFQEELGKPIDLMKIDIQGAETAALAGASRVLSQRQLRNVIVGTHSKQIHAAVVAFLKGKSYRILFEQQRVKNQPDGIVIAATGKRVGFA